jgi:phenylacetic acid degradation operon negative regulatory protein
MSAATRTSHSVEEQPEAPEGKGSRPRSLIVSFFGAYGREIGGWVSVAGLIRLMAELDIPDQAIRSAVSRLKQRDIVHAERVGGIAGYRLTGQAQALLAAGDRRIYTRRIASIADGWVLAAFSVPESQRRHRHLLRSQLTWLGYGTVAPGLWIAPVHLAEETRKTLAAQGLQSYVELFTAEHYAFAELAELVGTWWDLDGLRSLYEDFLQTYEPLLRKWNRRRSIDGAEAFADSLRAVDAWRQMPFLDPGLPLELLPANWAGNRASNVFFALDAKLRAPGRAFVHSVFAD